MNHGLNMLLKGGTTHPFSVGDEMRYVGYATINGIETMSLLIQKHQTVSEEIILVFDTAGVDDGQPCPYAATLTDVDGNTYNTVQIGNQCWMKENLRTTRYADGTSIEQGSTTSYDVAYWYYPNNDATNKDTYGLLYNWKAVMRSNPSSDANPSGVQGICPTGWHVPSDAEWTQLTDYVSTKCQYTCNSDSEYIAKALADTTGWNTTCGFCDDDNVQSDNNATGFSALPAGSDNNIYAFGNSALFWSATENYDHGAYSRLLYCNYAYVSRYSTNKLCTFSVRCLRD